MSDKLRVGVVGSGIGRQHINGCASLPDQFQVMAICDIDEARARALAAECNIPRVVTSLDELCRMDDVDVINICTPPYLHLEQTLQALEAGKHAICEKPIVGSLKQIDELIAAEQRLGRRVMPVFQYRFGHGVQKLKFLIEQGVTGRVYLSTAETAWRRRPAYYAVEWRGKWKTELGGPLVSHAVHAHDVVSYILGPAKSVFARTATRVNQIETEDCASVSLEMADGSLCSLSVTIGSAQEISRHRFCFSNLTAESNLDPYRNTSDPWTFTPDSPELEQQIEETLSRFVPLAEGFEGQFYRFYHALQNNTELPVTLVDARISLELVTAMYHSAQTGQAVELPIGQDHPKYANYWPQK